MLLVSDQQKLDITGTRILSGPGIYLGVTTSANSLIKSVIHKGVDGLETLV